MVDFLDISTRTVKNGVVEVFADFDLLKCSDIMIRGGDFYCVWLEDQGIWSTDETEVIKLVDNELMKKAEELRQNTNDHIKVSLMRKSSTKTINRFHDFCKGQLRDRFHNLNERLVFADETPKRKDYASIKLPYALVPCPTPAYDSLMSVLYSPEERRKLEWAIGSIITGDSKKNQKFMVLYGSAGTGKSTVLNIIEKLFEGYHAPFNAKALGDRNNNFPFEPFKNNPLVAIQHDGDLSKIDDNTNLNSLVSHEYVVVNEKNHSMYKNKFKCFLFMGTNKPVKITEAKSGLLRRLIDVSPTGEKIPRREYDKLIKQVEFELGGIACHCRDVYLEDPGYYNDYVPQSMLGATNPFYNFMLDNYSIFYKEDGATAKAAFAMYKDYCEDTKLGYTMNYMQFKDEFKNYFVSYQERCTLPDGTRARSYYSGFRTDKFESEKKPEVKNPENKINFIEQESIFDKVCADCPAQYSTDAGTPSKKWANVTTKLSDIDSRKLHYVKVPENHIVIDFDIPDESGNKSFEKNLEAASKWPQTYAELSKSGAGIHLHYIYTGDVNKLSRVYDDHIEVKVFTGNSSLRRMLTKCNDIPISTISSGLPLKGDNKLVSEEVIKSEKSIRTLIKRNLNKEYHPATKPSIDFIFKILEDAYTSGVCYDVTNMRNAVLAFAAGSTHQADYCIKLVNKMHFKSEEASVPVDNEGAIVFYDIEVFPNLLVVNWKYAGDAPMVRMINPSPTEIEALLEYKLIGFNCRKYDNHILYARLMGYTNEQIYRLSVDIIQNKTGFFGEAYNISYTDIYDFSAKKQSLKKWEIELGIRHLELGLPWDKPVPEHLWGKVSEYCDNDVIATEKLFEHLQGDFTARKILAELAGMTVNDTTNSLTTRIIFGNNKKPNLVYTDLATGEQTEGGKETTINSFPGYSYENGKNMYRGTDLGKGGYVYAEPGIYGNVALLDIASLHPNSIIQMNCFGDYTQNFKDILDARIYIKHKDFDSARNMLDGKLAPYLDDPAQAKNLAQALKIAINSVYGLTSASFDNPFRDIRNANNIVALRGALFMRTLQDEVVKRGYTVAHIKTDSIKIPNADMNIINFCMEFAKKYGYTFEHEATYDKMCLINDAVYIARYKDKETCEKMYGYCPGDNFDHGNQWTATGKQFAVPYVFKSLFSKEPIVFDDMCEVFSVSKGELYLDMNENLTNVEDEELVKELRHTSKPHLTKREIDILDRWASVSDEELDSMIAEGHNLQFVGRVGQFTPIKPGNGAGVLYRICDGKNYAASGSKGFRWLESEMVLNLKKEDQIDRTFYQNLVDDAVEAISKYGDFEWFASDDDYLTIVSDKLPF